MRKKISRAIGGKFGKLTDEEGRYDAKKVAEALDWTHEEVARYLGKSAAAISKNPTSRENQSKLAELASIAIEASEALGGWAEARAWLRTPSRALNHSSPNEMIRGRQETTIKNLLGEIVSGSGFAL